MCRRSPAATCIIRENPADVKLLPCKGLWPLPSGVRGIPPTDITKCADGVAITSVDAFRIAAANVRIIRELQELSQDQLSEQTGIPQSTISAIERDRVNLGVERAKVLARALKFHPAVLVFPGWDVKSESTA
jgi:DNA-binding XRE family transcriptional regulator